jgi:ribonuclease-3
VSARDSLDALEEALGYRFRDRTLLERAVTHSSFAHESGAAGRDNERLEFLGDSVLNFLVAEQLYRGWPALDEGSLSKARSHFVSETSFSAHAGRLGVGGALRLAAGESRSGGHAKVSLLADAFEALFAAILLDGGLEAARSAAERILGPEVASLDVAALVAKDAKTALQELAQARGEPLPGYRLVSESGPDHEKRFVYEVSVGGVAAAGEGPSKKEAQQSAAARLLELLSRAPAG